MAKPRIELQAELEELLGSKNVYFQPPETIKLKYPCIIYERETASQSYGDDELYDYKIRYSVTLIDKNPDSEFIDKLINLRYCTFNRHYTINNLNHDVFYVYY